MLDWVCVGDWSVRGGEGFPGVFFTVIACVFSFLFDCLMPGTPDFWVFRCVQVLCYGSVGVLEGL